VTYDEKIIVCFRELCEKQGGASPAEVTELMREKGWLSPFDIVLDIAVLMKRLREEGRL
jgi:hypothetical protein